MVVLSEELATEYVRGGGLICPFCGAEHQIEGAEVEIENGSAFQAVVCAACGRQWTDVYALIGMNDGMSSVLSSEYLVYDSRKEQEHAG